MKKLLSIIVAFSTIVVFAADKVEIRITNQFNKMDSTISALNSQLGTFSFGHLSTAELS